MAKKQTKYTVSDGELTLTLEVAEEGGFTVTSPLIPGLVTEAETLQEAFEMARDATTALREAAVKSRRATTVVKKPQRVGGRRARAS